jgi:CHAD domain-containing protein
MAGKDKPKVSDNGEESQAMLASLQALNVALGNIIARQDELEEQFNKKMAPASSKLVDLYFNTDARHIHELSWIAPLAATPFAEAIALENMSNEEIRSGKVSLLEFFIEKQLRFNRSVRGRLVGLGAESLREQVSSEAAKEDEMQEFKAGEE